MAGVSSGTAEEKDAPASSCVHGRQLCRRGGRRTQLCLPCTGAHAPQHAFHAAYRPPRGRATLLSPFYSLKESLRFQTISDLGFNLQLISQPGEKPGVKLWRCSGCGFTHPSPIWKAGAGRLRIQAPSGQCSNLVCDLVSK